MITFSVCFDRENHFGWWLWMGDSEINAVTRHTPLRPNWKPSRLQGGQKDSLKPIQLCRSAAWPLVYAGRVGCVLQREAEQFVAPVFCSSKPLRSEFRRLKRADYGYLLACTGDCYIEAAVPVLPAECLNLSARLPVVFLA